MQCCMIKLFGAFSNTVPIQGYPRQGLPPPKRYQDIKLALKFAHVPKRKLSFGLNLCACSISNYSEFKD